MRLVNPYKLLLVDVDGTLLGESGTISVEDRNALAKACDSGLLVSLSTGRAAQACLSVISKLALDSYHIFSDGALISNPNNGKEIYAQPIDKTVVKQAIEFAHLNEIDLDLYSATHYFVERESWSAIAHRQYFGIEPTVVDFDELWNHERIIKGGLAVTSSQEAAKVRRFRLQFEDSLYFSFAKSSGYPDVDFFNIVAPEVSKGKALRALTSHLGISLAEVVAVGDGTNDISLLSSAGLAIAMGGAPDELKAVADYVTLDVEHSGLAAAINKFLL
ncbi:Phosphatase YwpJ [subsurface metagenome]